jgi:2-C-methyl-D-erythritol 4-phosphate cytidylyltransferase
VTSPRQGKDFAAVVTAAGASRRMGLPTKKEYRFIDGVPVLALAVRPFMDAGLFRRVVVTVPRGQIQAVKDLISPHIPAGDVDYVEGGGTRQESILNALAAMEKDPPWGVLVHDGARPWISRDLILRVLECVMRCGGCVPVVEVTEAVKQAGEDGFVARHIKRETLSLAQTPQGFRFAELLAAYRAAAERGVRCADDAELYDMFQGPVAAVPGDVNNRKITYERDMPPGRGKS